MKPVTVWQRLNPDTHGFEHNHIETGHSEELTPNPNSKYQQLMWRNQVWESYHAFLDEHYVLI